MGSRFRIIHIVIIICLLFVSGCVAKSTETIQPLSKKGILDLRNWDFEKDGIVSLNGEWEFFWNHLLKPEYFASKTIPPLTGYFDFPGIWNNYVIQNKKTRKLISGKGYATFVLIILHNG